ncbi:MAG TPA: DUF4159 domain-containing protein [Magnetospirillaceae bacterium]|jgi:hypothetical protein
MWTVGPLTFAAPWALVFLAVLPLLWWLLRVVPPAPRRLTFPAIRLLLGLKNDEQAAAHTPWWLVALRLLIAGAVIVAVARPLLDVRPLGFDGPLLLAIDDDWAAADHWRERRALMTSLLSQVERDGRLVAVLATAPRTDGEQPQVIGPMAAGTARSVVDALAPLPWPADRTGAVAALNAFKHTGPMRVVWLANGLKDAKADIFAAKLRDLGALEVAMPERPVLPHVLLPPDAATIELTPTVLRADRGVAEKIALRALDAEGRTLMRVTGDFGVGQDRIAVPMTMPAELRNRVTRVDLDTEASAGAVALLDARWQRRPVGLVTIGAGGSSSPLLDALYYVDRAMSPFAEVRRGTIEDLLKRDLSMIVLPDSGSLSDDQTAALKHWVEAGGMLLRLAGPQLARSPDELLPVQLRGGGRSLGGAMSWTQPMALAPMPNEGPFAGLAVPDDVRVATQVLAEPEIDLNRKTWARLADGTPLVTGVARGRGWLVLLHTTARPQWSNLGFSGLFPDMLRRLLELSRGVAGASAERPLPPLDMLDGFGRMIAPNGLVEALPPRTADIAPGPRHPPGYYGDDSGRVAVNLGPHVPALTPMAMPPGAARLPLDDKPAERDLQPPILLVAALLLLLDALAVAILGGWIRWRSRTAVAILAAFFVFHATDSRADDDTIIEKAALQTRLAYVITGDARVDETSRLGLAGLTLEIKQRTTANLGDPMGVDVTHDPLMAFPLLYWPVTADQTALPPAARAAVNDFMRKGGMIMFDTRDGGQGSTDPLRHLTEGIDIPPLIPVTSDHVLTRTFYLLREEPGRITGGQVFVEQGGDPSNDGVSPVVIGGNDYAAAWAIDEHGIAPFAIVPGGEEQREMAFRFGINLVMYALTGSYKSDQVHLPIILERLKR